MGRLGGFLRAVRTEAGALARLLSWVPVWLLPFALVAATMLSTQRPAEFRVDVGSPRDEAFVRNFHTRLDDGASTYRWSDIYGYVTLPGVGGSRPFSIELVLDVPRTEPVTIIVNGESLFEQQISPGWQTIDVAIDSSHPAALSSRDLVVEMRAPEYRNETDLSESKGVKLDKLTFRQTGTGGLIWPALAPTAWLAASVLALYLLVGRALWDIASLRRARHWGFVCALLGAAAIAWLYDASRVDAAAVAGQVLATLLTGLLLLVLGDWLLRRWVKYERARLFAVRAGAAALALAFVLRFGGMGLPQAVIIDMPWHMKWLTTLLAGNWQALYYPGGLSSVPAEWGLELLIPKSPLFYLAAAPAALVPFDHETAVKWLTCLLDSSLVIVAFWFALRVRAGVWAAAGASALYALIPLAFRAFAYGILPTIFAQWLAAMLFAVALAQSERRPGRLAVVGTVLLAALTMVAFPTVAVFVTLVLLGFVFLLGRKQFARERANAQVPIAIAVAGGWAIAILAYYGLYIESVTASATALLAGGDGGTSVRWPSGPGELLTWTADYVVTLLPLLLAVVGLAALSITPRRRRARLALWFLALWLAILPVFLAVNYRMDMIGKHLFFTMLPVAVLGGAALGLLWPRRRWSATLATLLLVVVSWQGLVFWVDRLVRAST